MRFIGESVIIPRHELTRAVHGASGGVVQLAAPRGFGKTTLLHQVVKHPPDLAVPVSGRQLSGATVTAETIGAALPEAADTPHDHASPLDWICSRLGAHRLLLAVDEISLADGESRALLLDLVATRPDQVRLVVAGRAPWDEPYDVLSSDVDIVFIGAEQLLISRRELEALRGVVLSATGRDAVFEASQGWPAAIPAAVGKAVGAKWAPEEESKLTEFMNRSVLRDLSDDQCMLLQAAVRAGVAVPRQLIGDGEVGGWPQFPMLVEQVEPFPGIRPEGLLREAIFRKATEADLDRSNVAVRLAETLCDLERFSEAARVVELIEPDKIADLMLFLGPALVTQGNDAAALSLFERFTTADFDRHPTLVLTRSVMCGMRGDVTEALAWLQEYDERSDVHRETSELGRLVAELSTQFVDHHPTMAKVDASPPGWPRLLMHLIASFTAYQVGDHETSSHHQIAVYRTSNAYPLIRIWAASSLAFLHLRRGQVEEAEQALTVAEGLGLQHGLGRLNSTALGNAVSAWIDLLKQGENTGRAHIEQAIRKLESMPHGVPFTIGICQVALLEAALISADPHVRFGVASHVRNARARIGGLLGSELDDLLTTLTESRPAVAQSSPLTRAETSVLHYLSTHLSMPQIATQLHLSPATVRSHAHAIYRKLGVNSRAEAVSEAERLSLLPH